MHPWMSDELFATTLERISLAPPPGPLSDGQDHSLSDEHTIRPGRGGYSLSGEDGDSLSLEGAASVRSMPPLHQAYATSAISSSRSSSGGPMRRSSQPPHYRRPPRIARNSTDNRTHMTDEDVALAIYEEERAEEERRSHRDEELARALQEESEAEERRRRDHISRIDEEVARAVEGREAVRRRVLDANRRKRERVDEALARAAEQEEQEQRRSAEAAAAAAAAEIVREDRNDDRRRAAQILRDEELARRETARERIRQELADERIAESLRRMQRQRCPQPASVETRMLSLARCPVRTISNPEEVRRDAASSIRCSVCLEPYVLGDRVRTLPCFHTFHTRCIDQWLCQKADCPVCKHPCV